MQVPLEVSRSRRFQNTCEGAGRNTDSKSGSGGSFISQAGSKLHAFPRFPDDRTAKMIDQVQTSDVYLTTLADKSNTRLLRRR